MVGEYLMFFQNNTRSNKFNQPKVQWHSVNIGYRSVQVLHPRLASCAYARLEYWIFVYLPFGNSGKFFSKNTFSVEYRVSQKFVPLISCTIAFCSNLYFYMKFLQDIYFSIKYMYSEFQ